MLLKMRGEAMNPQQPNDSEIGKSVAKIVRDAIGALNHTHIGYSSEHDYLADPYIDDIMSLIQDEILKARKDENMQTRIIAKLAYVKGGKLVDTAKLIELLDEREAELSSQLKTKEE